MTASAALAPPFDIRSVSVEEDLATVRRLFRDYAASLDVDLTYQGFEAELGGLPGAYAPPRGALLLALDRDGTALGVVALRPQPEEGCCEMKRLYVPPAGRGRGVAQALVHRLATIARGQGYRLMRLDTLPSMGAAQGLYRKLGFVDVPAYYATPIAGTRFMALSLAET